MHGIDDGISIPRNESAGVGHEDRKTPFIGYADRSGGSPALAQPSLAAVQSEERAEAPGGWHGDSRGGWRRPHFGERRSFDDHDRTLWRGGHWAHERHGGRFGWWWVAGDGWFFYPDPVYPYPDPDVMPQQDAT